MALDNPFHSIGADCLAAQRHLLYTHTHMRLALKIDKDTESIDSRYRIRNGNMTVSPDFFLPNGCAKLGLPEKTAIELKQTLQPDSLYNIDKLAKSCIDSKFFNKVILLYSDFGDVELSIFDEVRKSGYVQVFQVDEFFGFKKKGNKKKDLTWNEVQEIRMRSLIKDLCNYPVSFFLGAGISMSAGMPSWDELLKSLLLDLADKECHLDASDFNDIKNVCNHSAIILGRYMMYKQKNSELGTRIRRVLYDKGNPSSALIDAICNLIMASNTESVITYNYDDLIETALEEKGVATRRLFGNNRRLIGELPVYHVHGLVPYDGKIQTCPVLSEQEYHERYQEAYHWSNVEQIRALSNNTCVFIGLSMSDPNLRRLLDIAKSSSPNEQRHYAFLKIEPLSNKSCEKKDTSNLNILDTMLQSFGINTIWYEQHDGVPILLKKITNELSQIKNVKLK